MLLAQDVIVKTSGDEIQAKVIEITNDEIKYKDFDHQDGPIRNIKKSVVFMIIYENGDRETITPDEDKIQAEQSTPPVNHLQSTNKKEFTGMYSQASVGMGVSYGGIGVNFSMRFGGILGYGFHAGVGYIINGNAAGVAGFKFYPYKNLYFNAVFGIIAYEEIIYKGWYYYTDVQALYGPGFLFGGEWAWGSKIKYGFNAAVGYKYLINYRYVNPNQIAVDLGFIIQF